MRWLQHWSRCSGPGPGRVLLCPCVFNRELWIRPQNVTDAPGQLMKGKSKPQAPDAAKRCDGCPICGAQQAGVASALASGTTWKHEFTNHRPKGFAPVPHWFMSIPYLLFIQANGESGCTEFGNQVQWRWFMKYQQFLFLLSFEFIHLVLLAMYKLKLVLSY